MMYLSEVSGRSAGIAEIVHDLTYPEAFVAAVLCLIGPQEVADASTDS